MQFRSARFSAALMGLTSLFLAPGCAEGEEITARGGAAGRPRIDGGAGSSGAAGSNGTETGGSGGTGPTGSGGAGGTGGGTGGSGGTGAGTGTGGKSGAGGTGGRGGSGGSTGGSGGSTGGSGGSTGGSGGSTGGSGGSTGGSGGSTGGSGGSTGGTGGFGGTGGVGGAIDGGGTIDGSAGACPAGVSYCADFERDLAGGMPTGWTRVGGSDGDWKVIVDGSNAFAQDHASSSTFRLCYPNGALGAPWNGATTVSARVKILASGSSGTTTALLCLGYGTGSGGSYACLTLEQGAGARIRMNAGSSPTDGPLWPASITVGTWYDVKIAVDGSGAVSAHLNGTMLGAYMPSNAITGGYVAVATQSAKAAFDMVTVTQP